MSGVKNISNPNTKYVPTESDKRKARTLLFAMRLEAMKHDFVGLDKRFHVTNGGVKCDMYKGHCACGAHHYPGDIEDKCKWVYE